MPIRASLRPGLFVLVFFLSGCATLPQKVEGEIVPPGSGAKTWSGIKESGIAEDCGFIPLPQIVSPKGKKNFFSKIDKQVTWWALFQPMTFGLMRASAPGFTARWYAPNGVMYWEENFAGDLGLYFAKNSLPIAGTPAETFPGRWRVQIYHEGRLIDEKEFIINLV